MKKICQQCNKEFSKAYNTSRKVFIKQKFCGQECFGLSRIGIEGYWTGKTRSRSVILAMRKANIGKRNSPATEFKKVEVKAWDIVGGLNQYRALHHWVERQLGKPEKCSECGKVGYGRQMHWANKSKTYQKNLKDWVRLCVKCHYEFDENRKILPVKTPLLAI
jgi:hypothetical protein